MRLLTVCATALCAAASLVAAKQTDLSSSFNAARSAPILVGGLESTTRDSHAILLDSSRYFSAESAPASLPLQSLSSVLAHAMGLRTTLLGASSEAKQMMPAQPTGGKPAPKAQVIFNVESVGKSTLDHFQLNSLASPSTPHVSVSLSTPAVTPASASISIAASLSTGAPISSHGIVAARWKNAAGKVVSAFERRHAEETFADVNTLADNVATQTYGKGVTLSVSGSEALAWAFGVNKVLADKQRTWANNYCIALGHSNTLFKSVSTNSAPALDFSLGNLETQLLTSSNSVLNNLGAELSAKLDDSHVVTLTYASAKAAAVETVKFDLRSKADATFLAELQYALDLPSKLKAIESLSAALNDEAQDLIVVSFSGFTGLVEAYGRESEQFRGALRMFQHLFPLLSSEYASLTQSATVMQSLVFLGAHASALEKQDPRKVEAILKADGVNVDLFPAVYVAPHEVAATCAKLNKDLASVAYVAYCPSATRASRPHVLVESASEASSSIPVSSRSKTMPSPIYPQPIYTYPSRDDRERYQIVLWFAILISCAAIAAVYTLAFMTFKKDTMLYSSFNPNWEDRKRR